MVSGNVNSFNSACARTRPDPQIIKIGKDIIELVTSGMYVSPLTIYREYLQNAADSIDAARACGVIGDEKGKVTVQLDHAARTITIRDNGAAIPAKHAAAILMAIGSSQKRQTRARGFRGVGRLSGIAYCRELEFRSKAAGERQIVSVVWDCRGLRSRLADGTFKDDLRTLISDSVSLEISPWEDRNEHFFEVILRDVSRHRQDLLLNEREISHYLSQVAPVPFSSDFRFARKIRTALNEHGIKTGALGLTVGGEAVYRPYRDEIPSVGSTSLQVRSVEIVDFANVDGEVGAVGWIAHHDYLKSISSTLGIRGLRARVGDVQVGDANLFDEVFREPRFNGWAIGELHVLDRRIVPNGRRDGFEVNHHAYNLFAQLGPLAQHISNRCRSASVGRNAEQIIRNTLADTDKRLAQRPAITAAELGELRACLSRASERLKKVPEDAREKLEKDIARTFDALTARKSKKPPVVTLDLAVSLVSRIITNRDQARKLIAELEHLCAS